MELVRNDSKTPFNEMIGKHRQITGSSGSTSLFTEQGFTLLEVLLAFFIFTILFITIYSSYTSSFQTVNKTEARMEVYRMAAIALERISEDLQASYISVLPPDSFGRPADYTQFLGENADMNGQDADNLSFFARITPIFSDEEEAASGQLISYSIVRGNEEDELVLLRSEKSEFSDNAEERAGLVLSSGLKNVNFTYFDEDGESHESWDSDDEQSGGGLPRMVSISLEYINDENPEALLKVMTSVAVAVDYVPRL